MSGLNVFMKSDGLGRCLHFSQYQVQKHISYGLGLISQIDMINVIRSLMHER